MPYYQCLSLPKWRRPASMMTAILCLLNMASSCFGFLPYSTMSYPFHSRIISQLLAERVGDVHIEGLLSEEKLERGCQIHATVEALRQQLPRTLTQRLTTAQATANYNTEFCLTIQVDDEEIELVKSPLELVALSEVLVISAQTTQRANSVVFGAGGNSLPDTTDGVVNCQFFVQGKPATEDDKITTVVVPWKAEVPIFLLSSPSLSAPLSQSTNGSLNRFEGCSKILLDENGKILRHRISSIRWNGQSISGPAIVRTLKTLQAAANNIRRSPLMRSNNNNNNGPWDELRDGLLEQAASAITGRSSVGLNNVTGTSDVVSTVYSVSSSDEISGWVKDPSNLTSSSQNGNSSDIPIPGTAEWPKYVAAHRVLQAFAQDIVPWLSGERTDDNEVSSSYFSEDATLITLDGSTLLQGKKALSDFYQGLALARAGTGGKWSLKACQLLDWKHRRAAIDYVAINQPLTIRGRDEYTLTHNPVNEDGRREGPPRIQEIQQVKLKTTTGDGGVSLDSQWLMKNLASAIDTRLSGTPSSTVGPDEQAILTDLLMQQQSQQRRVRNDKNEMKAATIQSSRSNRVFQVSPTAAANVYYIMADLHESLPAFFGKDKHLLPGEEFLAPEIELKGYLGETLLQGAQLYKQTLSTLRSTIRQAIKQQQLVLVETTNGSSEKKNPKCTSVELTAAGRIRYSIRAAFRLPPLPGVITAGVPLQLDLLSEYVIDPDTGLILQHRLLETRVNGQLTPGDVLTRNLQRFFRSNDRKDGSMLRENGAEDTLRSFIETLSWLRGLTL